MICEKCGIEHNQTCCPRCTGMGMHTGFYTSTIAAPDHRAARRRDLLTMATQLLAHGGIDLANEGAWNESVRCAKGLIAAVDAEIAKEKTT